MIGFEPRISGVGSDLSTNHATTPASSHIDLFLKMGQPPAYFSFIFVFSNTHYNFYNKKLWKNVHPVYSAGIQTRDLWITSLLP